MQKDKIEHEIWAIPPKEKKQIKIGESYSQDRWQWAEKVAQYLIEKGFKEVEVIDRVKMN